MTNIVNFISELRKLNIRLHLEGEKLKVNAPSGALTTDIKSQLTDEKDNIIDFLRQANQEPSAQGKIPVLDRSQNLPLSYAQHILWILDQLQPGLSAYNMPLSMRIKGAIDHQLMAQTFIDISTRHEVLRISFTTEDDIPYQTVHPQGSLSLDIEDVSDSIKEEEEDLDAAALRLATFEASTPFDLSTGPLFRGKLIKLADNDHVLMATMHHAVSDGWSVNLLMQEIIAIYGAISTGAPSPLPKLTVQYVDYAAWQRDWLDSEVAKQQLDYWQKNLAGVPPLLRVPTDRPRPTQQTFNGDHFYFTIPKTITNKMKNLAQQEKATLFMVLLASQQLLLSRYADQTDVCVGIPSAGRTRQEIEGLIGFFVNVLFLRTDLSGNCTVSELISRVKKTTLGAFNNENIPQEMILETLEIERNPSYPPLIQVGFALQNMIGEIETKPQNFGDIEISPVSTDNHTAKYDMVWFMTDREDTIDASVEYNTDLFDESTIARMSKHLIHLMDSMASDSEQHIDALALVTNDELYQTLNLDQNQFPQLMRMSGTVTDLYLAHALKADTLDNCIGQYFEIHSEVEVALWPQALQSLVDSYSMLRARVVSSDSSFCDMAYFAVAKEKEVNFIFTDISEQQLSDGDFVKYIDNLVYQPYKIETNELCFFELIKRAPAHYAFVIRMNHMLADGIAMSTIMKQAIENYQMLAAGDTLRVWQDNYPDYIPEALNIFDTNFGKAFWRERLATIEALSYPGQTLGNAQTRKLVSKYLTVDPEHLKAAQKFGLDHEHRMSIPRYFRLLFCLLINNYCRAEDDFEVQDAFHGRSRSHMKSVGVFHQRAPFVFPNHLLQADCTISDLFKYSRDYDTITRDCPPLSLATQNQIAPKGPIGFMYNFYKFDMKRNKFQGEKVIFHTLAARDLADQVQLVAMDEGDNFVLSLHYSNDVFDDNNLLERLIELSKQIVDGVEAISDLHIVGIEEQKQLLSLGASGLNDTCVKRPPTRALHHLFEQQVEKTPDAIAVSYLDQSWSYQELNSRSNQLAHYLRKQGVGPDSMVGVAMERSLAMSIALIAIIKAGGAYVPFDPSFPTDRLAYMLEDTEVTVMLTQSHLVDRLPPGEHQVLCLDTDTEKWTDQDSKNPSSNIGTINLFNVIFTSGSTGKPKGVMVLHRGIINRLLWMQEQYPLTEADHVLQKTPYSFDVSVWELFWPLLVGARLVYAKPEGHKDPEYLRDLINESNISTLHFVPSMLGLFLETDGLDQCRSIRQVFCSGEALQLEHERRFFEQFAKHDAQLHNLYGPTEASVDVSYFACQANSNYHSVPIGKPVTNTQLHILDEYLRPVPLGLVGELYIGGVQLARGYLKREQLTRDTFIENPYYKDGDEDGHPSKRLYKTGDLARYKTDGNIEYIGRVDFQVKVRGLRIELGEIETVLHQHEQVKETIVTTMNIDDLLSKDNVIIVAYVVAEDTDNPPDAQTLREHLRIHIPEYMIPNAFVALAAIPLSPNGKANRKALPVPELAQQAATEYAAPRNETEQQIATIWQEVLNIVRIGINDNFFELGGHSLLATKVVSRLNGTLKLGVTLKQIFEFPTITKLIDALQGSSPQSQALTTAPPLLPVPRDNLQAGDLALSYAQQRLWIIDQLDPGSPMYNMPFAIRIRGTLQVDVLQNVFKEIVRRHDSLRTRFASHKSTDSHTSRTYQIIDPVDDWQLPYYNVDDDEVAIMQRAAEFMLASFNLANGPLFKAELLQVMPRDGMNGRSDTEYILLANMHHIISDGWSLDILLREILFLYDAFSKNMPSPLPELVVQYADFAQWQRNWLEGEILEQQVSYWQENLAGVPVLELPTDYQRSSVPDPTGKNAKFQLSANLSEQLRNVANQNGATIFMTLLTAFQLLLARYSGQEDISVGSPIANRTTQELEPIIGFFVNTLVLRTQVEPHLSFNDLLANVKRTTLDAYQHQDVSFERLVDALEIPRELTHSPLFQVLFVFQSATQAASTLEQTQFGDLEVSLLSDGSDEVATAKFDMSLSMSSDEQCISGLLEYRTALFAEQSIERFIQHFETLLQSIAQQPTLAVGQLSMLSAVERQQLLVDWNDAANANYEQFAIHHRFEQSVEHYPDNTAIVCDGETISYETLNKRANQVAHALAERGVKVGDFIGLCLERSIDLLAGLLGILKAGGAYIPLDPHFPADRLEFILADSQAKMLVTSTDLQDSLANFEGSKLLIDDQQLLTYDDTNLNVEVPLESTIYVLYTSGTTGKPKGCLVSHGNVARLFSATDSSFGFTSDDVWTLFHSYAFDFTVWEIWGALLYGGKLVVVPYYISRSPEEFYTLLIKEKVTILNQTPSAFSQLIAVDAMQSDKQHLSLRTVVFGGEALDFNALQTWVDKHGLHKPQLINMYGITETTVHVTEYRITEQDMINGGSIIGRPIKDLQVHILDPYGQLVPVGVAGEMHISGPGVTYGYLKRDDLSAEKFINNPFLNELSEPQQAGHQRLYRSGDLARYQPNGDIEYLGRIDLQVKIRGHRIELGEIEAALAQLNTVREAVVVVHGEAENKQLAAYLLLPKREDKSEDKGEIEADISLIRQELKINLPEYMIPAAFTVLEQWPLTPTGKVDKKALPEPEIGLQSSAEYLAPRNETEIEIAKIWTEVLDLEKIGIHDNFFELGGHSLLATQVIARLRETFDIELPLRILFEQPTVFGLADIINSSDLHALQVPPIVTVNRDSNIPLSFNQQRLWFIQQLDPRSGAYNMPVALRIHGSLDKEALRSALENIVRRHEILRTAFVTIDDQPVQVISEPPNWQLPIENLSQLTEQERETQTKLLVNKEAAKPFDLSQAPLLRTSLLKLQEDQHVLLVTMHHIISDGGSLNVLMMDLAAFYKAASTNKAAALPPLPVQYADFAHWQRHWLSGDVLASQLEYWVKKLKGAPRLLNLPTDFPRPKVQTDHGAIIEFTLSTQQTRQVREFSQSQNLTPFMTLLAGYQLLLSRYASQQDICVGVPIAGRNQRVVEGLVGFFVNSLIVRTDLSDNPTVLELVADVKDGVLGAFAHQEVPAELVIEELNIERSTAYNPIAQVGFNYQTGVGEKLREIKLDDIEIELIDADQVSAKYDMIWSFNETDKDIYGVIEYNTGLFSTDTVTQMAHHYAQLLEVMLADIDQLVSTIPIINDNELFKLLSLDRSHVEQILPLTAIQRDMYLDCVMNPDNTRSYIGGTIDMQGTFDAELWVKAFNHVVANEPVLRTRIQSCEAPYADVAYQYVLRADDPSSQIAVEIIDAADQQIDAKFHEQAKQLTFTAYDFNKDALIRSKLFLMGENPAGEQKVGIFICGHHIAVDGLSMGLVFHHTINEYEALLAEQRTGSRPPDTGVETPRDGLPSFSDYVAYNRANVDTRTTRQFWLQESQDIEALSTYVDTKLAIGEGQFISQEQHIDTNHWQAIKNYCRASRTTPTLYLKTVYALMLKTYCNSREGFYFNEVMLGRPKGYTTAMGCYFQAVPYIVSADVVGGEKSVKSLLKYANNYRKKTRHTSGISAALQRQALSQGKAQFIFNFYGQVSAFAIDNTTAPVTQYIPEMENSVNFICRIMENEVALTLTYTDNVFTDHHFIERFISVSKQIVGGTETLGELQFTLEDETQTLLPNIKETLNLETIGCVQTLLEDQAAKTPQDCAVICGDKQLTYEQLNQQANTLAHYLLNEQDIGADSRVAVCFEPGLELMVAILAVIKAGAAYLPLDPNYPNERLSYMLEDSHAQMLLSQSSLADRLPEADVTTLFLDTETEQLTQFSNNNPGITTSIDDMLYIIYTSGSTGRPKGAGVKHRGEINLLQWYTREFDINEQDKVLIISAIGFDLTQKNLFAALTKGGTIVFPDSDGYDDQLIAQLIEKHQISLINCAPSAFYPLVENTIERRSYEALNSLRLLLFGGEPIRVEKLLPWLQQESCLCQLINMYGPTECTDIASYYRVEEPDQFVNKPMPIGKANDNVQLYIMDSDNRLLPPGIPGELVIGGEGVGIGYLGKPELTDEVFFNNPLIDQDKQGLLYRTGDMVRLLADGNIEFIGRIDFQVKLRGLRIELGEIEYALRQLEGVTDALALVIEDNLRAYVTTASGQKPPEEWRRQLGNYLTDYMIPSSLVDLSEWPLTANGKIDRQALPEPDNKRTIEYVAPRNVTERKLATIWEEVLGLESVGINDDFFDIGGHSLLATRIAGRMRQVFNVELALRDLFEASTIAEIAPIIAIKAEQGDFSLPPLLPAPRDGTLLPSYAQQRLWFLDQLDPGNCAYNMPVAVRLKGNLQPEVLRQVFSEIVNRHESLRTTFATENNEPFLIINEIDNWQLPVTDLSELPESEQLAKVRELALADASAAFDLQQGPLFRTQLLRLSKAGVLDDQQDHVLLANMHHIISDGWSLTILFQEMAQLYVAFSHQQQSPLPALPVQYADYAQWQRGWLQGEMLDKQLDYWKKTMHQAPDLLRLPTDRPRPKIQTYHGALYRFDIDPEVSKKLTSYSQEQQVTKFMTTLAAFQLLLARYSNMRDICVGIPLAGRGAIETEALIGFFVNSMVIRSDLSGNPNLNEMLQRVKAATLSAFAHEHIPIETTLNALNVERKLSHPPIAQVSFQLQSTMPDEGLDSFLAEQFSDFEVSSIGDNEVIAKWDLTLTMVENESGLRGSIEYNTDLFDEATIARMMGHYETILEQMTIACEQSIETLSLTSTEELYSHLDVNPQDVETILPLPATMQDFYLANAMNPDTLSNSVGCSFDINHAINIDVWQEEMQHVLNQYAVLRGRVIPSKVPYTDPAYLCIRRNQTADFTLTDFSDRSLDEVELRQYINERIYKPYNINSDPLISFELVKLAEEKYVALYAGNHMIIDGIGMNHVVIQSCTNYFKRMKGIDTTYLPDIYSEFISASRKQFDRHTSREFWQQRLASVSALNFDMQTANHEDSEFIISELPVMAEHMQAIGKYCFRQRITPTVYFRAIYALMINYYCRPEADFVVRDTLIGRDRPQMNGVGCYMESPPFVFLVDLMSSDNSIKDLFEYSRDFTVSMKDHTQISLMAQRELLGSSNLNFLFNVLTYSTMAPIVGEDVPAQIYIPNEIDNHVQFLVRTGDSTILHLRYRNNIFQDLNFLERMLQISKQLIAGVERIGDLSFITKAEQQQLLSTSADAWNATKVDRGRVNALHHLFETQAEKTPDAIALSYQGENWTYREFNERANQLGHYLAEQGVGPDVMVGVSIERCLEMSLALMAILKAGGAYVPFDPSFPADRLGFMLEDTQAPIILSKNYLRDRIPDSQATIICLDIDSELWAQQPTNNINANIVPMRLFNVIFTSGSTGKPKGVMVPHQGIINRLLWMQETYQLEATDSVLQKTPYSFDVSVWELFWPLIVGAKLVYAKPDGHKDPGYLRDIINEEAITTLHFVPSMLGVFMQAENVDSCRSIKQVFCSGEALQLEHERLFFTQLADAELHNLYGPTEASVDVSYFACQKNSHYQSVPIGKPVANTQLHILDNNLHPVPVGIVGELYIGGTQLARGYLNREELTRETFISNPFYEHGHPSKRLYKTGDLARYLDDGNIEYIGRVDFQVKVRGLRIELGEIETLLHKHPDVMETIVITKDLGASGDSQSNVLIIAYVVSQNPDKQPTPQSLREHLKEQLPEYMLPNSYVMLDCMPLSANGKVNRKALPDPEIGQVTTEYVEARNDTEAKLIDIWQEVLGISDLGIHDNFFELGGNSMVAIHLVSQIENAFDCKLPLASLFEAQSVAQIAQLIESPEAAWSPLVPIQAIGDKPPLFVMHSAGAMILGYQSLAKYLPDDQPVYGLQATGFEKGQVCYNDLREMAAYYIESIRTKQPEGPYYLAGHSFGGMVAFEVAKQLIDSGEQIAFMGLLDSFILNKRWVKKAQDDASVVKMFIDNNIGDTGLSYRKLRYLSKKDMLDSVLAHIGNAVDRRYLEASLRVLRGFNNMIVNYEMQAIDIDITMIRPKGSLQAIYNQLAKLVGYQSETLGWEKYANGRVTLHQSDGDHFSMLQDPHIQELAATLASQLEVAQEYYSRPILGKNNNKHKVVERSNNLKVSAKHGGT